MTDLVLVPMDFKSLQLNADVPVAMTDVVSANPNVAQVLPFWFGVMSLRGPGMPIRIKAPGPPPR